MQQCVNRRERGGTFVEMAFIITPVLLLLFGAMTFSYAVFAYNNVNWIAREASRWASVRGSSSGRAASIQNIQDFARTRAAGLRSSHLNVAASFSPDNSPGSAVSVQVSYPVTPLVASIFFDALVVRGTSIAVILR